MNIEDNLLQLGITLPAPPDPVASYLPAVRTGNLVFVSGQIPIKNADPLHTGRVPSQVSIEAAEQCTRQCVYNALAILKAHLDGDLSRLTRVVRLGVFIASDEDFHGQSQIANAASDLLQQLLGQTGRHTRTTLGVNALPLNVPVEIEFTFEIQ